MPSVHTDQLFKLIKTLSKSEKRTFKLYVNRIQGVETAKFIQLFDVLDKQKKYDEEAVFKKIPSIKRSQLSNLKRHLTKQLLTSLRLIHISKNIDIEIREQLDFAIILYGKGLFLQSLKVLDRVKNIALESHQDLLHLQIIEFEKMIEARHITRSIKNRAEQLTEESERRGKVVFNTVHLSNLALKMYGFYIKIGHVRDEKETREVQAFFKANLPKNIEYEQMTFFEKIYYYQAHVWYYYTLQNFPQHYRYAQKWVNLFDEHPTMVNQDPGLYMRGLHNLLTALFYTSHYQKFCKSLEKLEAFYDEQFESLNTNSKILGFLYVFTAKIDKHFMEGSFSDGLALVPPLEKLLKKYEIYLDSHRIIVFYYKIACLYFGSGDNGHAIDYLNRILNFKAGKLREDIQSYARILHLIAHYEQGHYNLLEYLIKSVYRFLKKMEELNVVQREILKFLKRELYSDPHRLRQAFVVLKTKLEKLKEHPLHGRSFLYLDIISWLESKIENKSVQVVVQSKFKEWRR